MVEFLSSYQIPQVFENCSSEFTLKDSKYANCVTPVGSSPCELLKLHDAKNFRKYFLATVPSILSAFAVIFNLIFGTATLILWRNNKLSSKQRYAFLMSRTLSTVLALILYYIVLIAWKSSGFEYVSATIFILIASITFYTHSGTYLGMTTILYMAIVHPMQHRRFVTITRCITAICFIWLVSIALSLCMGLLGATLFYPETAPIKCPLSSCQKPFAITVVCLLSLFFVVVISFYAIMLYRMHQRQAKMRRNNTDKFLSQNVRSMNRLAFNMVTFATASLPILVVTIITTVNLESLASLGLGNKSSCKTYENGHLFWKVEVLASTAAIVWVLTMILDPIISCYIDISYRKALIQMWKRTKTETL
uniref:G_PROTEIN_RECEP_F1_2 domain-containing protein n=1 Tax=Syphacia muris TaxID=451379 RepID=A0A0N5A9Y1_9BILA